MTLANGDLTTYVRLQTWLPNVGTANQAVLNQMISSVSTMILGKLNRSRLFNQTHTRTFDGTGTNQIVLPDWPVTSIASVQMGAALINPYPLPDPTTGIPPSTFGYGYRAVLYDGESLPGQTSIMEFVNGIWRPGSQNIKVVYNSGYMVSGEIWTVPTSPFEVTVFQPRGIFCKDNGIVDTTTGITLTSVKVITGSNQYVPPNDPPETLTALGQYTFSGDLVGHTVAISYSFVPSDLEEATIQMVAERYEYRSRIGQMDKSLGGQETIRFLRGGMGHQMFPDLPPEVEAFIWPYASVIPPAIGAPV